ncbi:hypothetical protein MTO96_017816 [Rhipicephalus appendiculatus]
MDLLLATSKLAGLPVTARPPADRSQSSGVVQGVDGDFTDEALVAAVASELTSPNASCGKESGAWPLSRLQLPPTCLIARLRQPCDQALAGRVVLNSTRPQARAKLRWWELHPRWSRPRPIPCQPGAEQRRPPSGPQKQGSVKPRAPTKVTSQSHLEQENTNLRLLLRAVADLLPPESQLRSICLQAGRDLVDVIQQLGLQVLNAGSYTFVRRTGAPLCTATNISLASEGARYDWTTKADTCGSDHLPIVITPVGGRMPRTRSCSTVDWRAFRQQLQHVREDQYFLGLVAAAQAATIQFRVSENHPVPDLRHLNLRAAKRPSALNIALSSTGSMQSVGDTPTVADGRVGGASVNLSARREAVRKHGGGSGP